ncbi:uncharacterized protein LOC126824227 [Patella vulgata]|uniref:uncharacterized protein LOC126824227 n=1 Tax=Patella vulgata TaxID=6465 RepID=UPI00218090A7|nr:uncharacterized protein LOC126824227 [Patella vulgata]
MAEGGRHVPTRGCLPESDIIQTNFVFLKNALSSKPIDLLDALFSKKVFDSDDVEKIHKKEPQGSKAIAGEILQVLMGCGPGAYGKFKDCLRETNFKQALQRIEPGTTTSLPSTQKKPERVCFKLQNGLKVNICDGDLLDAHANVLVCSNYGRDEAEGEIAKRIKEGGGRGYAISLAELYRKEKRLSDWKVYQTWAGDLNFKCVYQAKIPPYISDGITAWLSNLKKLYSRILQKASKEKYVSITLPVLGADFTGGSTELCIEETINALSEHNREYLRQVNIVSNDNSSLQKLRKDLKSIASKSTSTTTENGIDVEDIMENIGDFFTDIYYNVTDFFDSDAVQNGVGKLKNVVKKIPRLKIKNSPKHDNDLENEQCTTVQYELQNGVVVFVYKEDVVEIDADILVCYMYGTPACEGQIGRSLRDKGGEKYVDSLDKLLKRAGGLSKWRMYPVDSGDLQFREVYQAIISSNHVMNDWLANLQDLYQFILSTADEKGYKSITFPVANTDVIDKSIEGLVNSIQNYTVSSIRKVNIVTNNSTTITKLGKYLMWECVTTRSSDDQDLTDDTEMDEIIDIDVYKTKDGQENETEDIEDSNISTMAHSSHKLSNGLVVHLRQDDVVDIHSDVIITSNYGKAEDEGVIAKRLRKKGGVEYVNSLKSLVQDIDGFEDWHIYSSKPGDLQFSEVYQAIIPPNPSADVMDDWLSNLRGLYSQILTTADAQGYTSITLPVLGSGDNGAAPVKCTEVLKSVLEEYVVDNLLDVYIVTKDDFIFTLLMTSW